MEIRGKIVLVTGASDGIGAACAATLRKRGASLVLTARSEDKLRAVGGSDALVVAGDITESGTRERVVAAAMERFGRIDVLINNAGAGLYAPSWSAPLDQARALFDLNFFAALHMIQLVVPHMRARNGGSIVNVSSIAGKMTLPWFTLYSASKYALGSLSDGLRMELIQSGIHVMTVCPGYVDTKFQAHTLAGTAPKPIAGRRQLAISAEACAEAIVRGIEKNKRTVVTPRVGWIPIAIARLLPRAVDARLAKIYSGM
jgi:short-subunit dehydrogenase